MPYGVLLSGAAERDRRKLSPEIRSRITRTLLALEQEPQPPGVAKLSGTANGWHIRVGDYRILFEVDDEAQTVLVLRVAHRREAYR
ncbi:MAG TPA: type II toxin-antitoxin system RelE/ParE family toxin [Methylomirabilota bacterium]|nr:type II toxin-antitoxin system RelE/ParE family toxin [Methylomirabilota bacterium]